MTGPGVLRRMLLVMAVGWLLLGSVVMAQTDDPGLPTPSGLDSFVTFTKYPARCAACRAEADAYHAAVDAYDALRDTYNQRALDVRSKTRAFLEADDTAKGLQVEYDRLYDDAIRMILEGRRDVDRFDIERQEEDTLAALQDALRIKDQNQAALNTGLHELEGLRGQVLSAMRATLARQASLFKCETECAPSELDTSDPAISVGPSTTTSVVQETPDVDDILSVVAKCSRCEPLADEVNAIRVKRRGFASAASSLAPSLAHNRGVALQLQVEREALLIEERKLYAELANAFSQGVGDAGEDAGGRSLQERDRAEQAQRLRNVAIKLETNANDIVGFDDLIALQQSGLDSALKSYAEATAQLEAAQRALADCEAKCPPSAIYRPFAAGFAINPAYVQPESFVAVVPKCVKCFAIAEALNKVLTKRYIKAFDIQETVAELDRLKADRAALVDEIQVLTDNSDRLVTQLSNAKGQAARSAFFEQMLAVVEQRQELEARLMPLDDAVAEQQSVLADQMSEHEKLSVEAGKLQQDLVVCEATCTTDLLEPEGDRIGLFSPFLPLPWDALPVRAKCAACQELADRLNQLRELEQRAATAAQTAGFRIATATSAIVADQAALDGVLGEESKINDLLLAANNEKARDAFKPDLQALGDQRRALESRIAELEKSKREDEAKRDRNIRIHQFAIEQGEAVKTQLIDCEKQKCPATSNINAVGLPGANTTRSSPAGEFVETNCAKCFGLASAVNDAVGSTITEQQNLDRLRSSLKATGFRLAEKQSRLEIVRARLDKVGLLMLTAPSEAIAEHRFGAEQSALFRAERGLKDDIAEIEAEMAKIEADIKTSRAAIDVLVAQADQLREDLAKCEKSCADEARSGTAINKGPPAAPVGPAGGFVDTDCPPCAAIASMLNDVVGSIATAQSRLAAERKLLAAANAAVTEWQGRLDALKDREAELSTLMLSERDADVAEEKFGAEQGDNQLAQRRLEDELPALKQKALEAASVVSASEDNFSRLSAQADKLRTELAQCEKACGGANGNNGTVINTAPMTPVGPAGGFVDTDCPPCAAVASRLNDALGDLSTAETTLAASTAAQQALSDAHAEKVARSDEISDRQEELSGLILASKDAVEKQRLDDEFTALVSEASMLLGEIKELAAAIAEAMPGLERQRADVATRLGQAQVLRSELIKCEKSCADAGGSDVSLPGTKPAAIVPVANLTLRKSQPDICRSGSDCGFSISLTNAATVAYNGPIFVRESMSIAAAAEGGWFCGAAGRGRSLCVLDADLAPGGSTSLGATVLLPRNPPPGAKNCASLVRPGAGEEHELAQAVQLGLARQGIDVGAADGLIGPRTLAGVAELSESIEIEDTSDLASVYAAIYGAAPFGTPGADSESCVMISLVAEPRRPAASVPQPDEEEFDDLPRPGLTIRIGPQDPEDDRHDDDDRIGVDMPGFEMPGLGPFGF